MREISLPQGYSSLLSVYETQKAIGLLKRLFADKLSGALRLHRVSAPLFVSAETGLNDDLNGVERPVSFDINGVKETAQVVHSLAKWKRMALKRYDFQPGEGLVNEDVEETISNIGRMGRVGMKSTDNEILNIMLGN